MALFSFPVNSRTAAVPALVAALLGLTAWLYLPALHGPFLHDDFSNVVVLRLPELSWSRLMDVAFALESGWLRRPVAALSFALNHYVGGPGPWSYKLVNLALHLALGVILFTLGGRLLRLVDHGAPPARAWVVALLAAAFWLLHPIQVSTAAYVVQRMTQLAALFMALGLLAYTVGRHRLARNRPGGIWIMAAGLATCLPLATLSKENGVLLPLYVLLIEAVAFAGHRRDLRRSRALRWVLGLLVVLPLTVAAGYFLTHLEHFLTNPGRPFTAWERLLGQGPILLFYLRLLLLPSLREFGLFHDDIPLHTEADWVTLGAWGIVLGMIFVAWRWRRRAPVLALGIGWFFVGHLLESTLLPLEPVYEHRNYLPSFGPLLALAYYLLHPALTATLPARRFAAAGLLALFAAVTFLRSEEWSSTERFFEAEARHHPDSVRARLALAHYFRATGNLGRALSELDRTARLDPAEASLPVVRLFFLCGSGRPTSGILARAEETVRTARYRGYLHPTLTALVGEIRAGRCPEVPPVGVFRITSLVLDNQRLQDQIPVADLYFLRSHLLIAGGRLADALVEAEEAIRRQPDWIEPLLLKADLALALGDRQRVGEALRQMQAADELSWRDYRHYIEQIRARGDGTEEAPG